MTKGVGRPRAPILLGNVAAELALRPQPRRKEEGPIPAPTLTMMTKSAGGALMDEFRYTSYAQEIIFGAGSLARLGEAVGRFSWRGLIACSTVALRRNVEIGAVVNVQGV